MDWFLQIMNQYGQRAVLRKGPEETEIHAFLQPVEEKGEQIPSSASSIGWTDGRLWLYLGREAVEPGDILLWNGMEFRVRSGRPYYIGGTLNHWWASLERRKETACGN